MFHQVEGLHIDKDINMGHLKGCLNYFIKEFFEVEKIKMRFRPSHFPFTEPSAEVDIGYEIKNGKIVIGEGDQWLEILGCGMVHPNVLKNVKVDSSKYQGYAFGIGIDRLAMLKYGINDLRAFFDCDYRWLNHFGFDPLDVPSNYRGLSRSAFGCFSVFKIFATLNKSRPADKFSTLSTSRPTFVNCSKSLSSFSFVSK